MAPVCEIVTIGSELLLGQIVDTNAAWLADTLNRAGVDVCYHSTVGDDLERMISVLRNAWSRADLVVCSGGLGPTKDDLTRQAIADLFGVPLTFRQDLMDRIEAFFLRAGYHMADNNRLQAYIPEGAEPILNPRGTAPGFHVQREGKLIATLPGVPVELKYLTREALLPLIKEHFALGGKTICYRVLKVTGLGESSVDREIGDLIRSGTNPVVGLLASPGDIKVRIAAEAENEVEALTLIQGMEEEIRGRLGKLVYGSGDDTLEGVVAGKLADSGKSLAVLDTVSGGGVALRLSREPGNSPKQGLVLSNLESLKSRLGDSLWEPPSASTVQEVIPPLVRKIAREAGADLGLVLLGFPEREEDGLRVELSIGVGSEGTCRAAHYSLGGVENTLYERCTIIGLDFLRKFLMNL